MEALHCDMHNELEFGAALAASDTAGISGVRVRAHGELDRKERRNPVAYLLVPCSVKNNARGTH